MLLNGAAGPDDGLWGLNGWKARPEWRYGGCCGLVRGEAIPKAAFAANYAVAAEVSGRIVSQTNTLTALTNMGQIGSLKENMRTTSNNQRPTTNAQQPTPNNQRRFKSLNITPMGAGAAPGTGQEEGGGDGEA